METDLPTSRVSRNYVGNLLNTQHIKIGMSLFASHGIIKPINFVLLSFFGKIYIKSEFIEGS